MPKIETPSHLFNEVISSSLQDLTMLVTETDQGYVDILLKPYGETLSIHMLKGSDKWSAHITE